MKDYTTAHPNVKQLAGRTFSFLTVEEFLGSNKRREAVWKCRCVCGKPRDVTGTHLLTGKVTSCSCQDIQKSVDAPTDGTKTCTTCKEKKPLCEYHISPRGWAGRANKCIVCANKNKSRDWLLWRYGITKEQFNSMKESQGGKCAICLKPSKLVVDHCHTSKKVRGLLCNGCNAGLGHFGESEETMLRAIAYLNANKSFQPHKPSDGLVLPQPVRLTNERN